MEKGVLDFSKNLSKKGGRFKATLDLQNNQARVTFHAGNKDLGT